MSEEYRRDMDEMTCPQCEGTMATRHIGDASLARCTSCSGVFISRTEVGALSEQEHDWHLSSGPRTEPLPRITEDMAPPPPSKPKARSFLESLFEA